MIHNNIRAIREAKGVSQSFIAKTLGVTRQAYHRMEKGHSEIKAEVLKPISTILEVPVEVFFDEKLTKSVTKDLKRRMKNASKRPKGA